MGPGQGFPDNLQHRRPKPGDKGHSSEVRSGARIWITGEQYDHWRAMDQHGVMLDILVQSWCDAKEAKRNILPHVGHRQCHHVTIPKVCTLSQPVPTNLAA